MTHVLVMAKAPVPGRVKTRLVPPLTYGEAAEVALACLADTLAAVAGCGAQRRVLALDGPVGDWLPEGFVVVPQRGAGLAERLAAAWEDAGGPGVQIGMDTPQVSAQVLDQALDDLVQPGVDAVLGPAADGGWWAIGLRSPDPRVFDGIGMSMADTGAQQLRRLRRLGLTTSPLPVLRDVDTIVDLVAVTEVAPYTRTAELLLGLRSLSAEVSFR